MRPGDRDKRCRSRRFSRADEFNRNSCDAFDRKRGTAARITVEFGEDQAGELERVVKGFSDVDRFLTQRAVGHEQDLIGLDAGAEFFYLFDEIGVDLEPTGGVENHAIGPSGIGGGKGGGTDGGDVLRLAISVETELFLFR